MAEHVRRIRIGDTSLGPEPIEIVRRLDAPGQFRATEHRIAQHGQRHAAHEGGEGRGGVDGDHAGGRAHDETDGAVVDRHHAVGYAVAGGHVLHALQRVAVPAFEGMHLEDERAARRRMSGEGGRDRFDDALVGPASTGLLQLHVVAHLQRHHHEVVAPVLEQPVDDTTVAAHARHLAGDRSQPAGGLRQEGTALVVDRVREHGRPERAGNVIKEAEPRHPAERRRRGGLRQIGGGEALDLVRVHGRERRAAVIAAPLGRHVAGTHIAFLEAENGNAALARQLAGDGVAHALAAEQDDHVRLPRVDAAPQPAPPDTFTAAKPMRAERLGEGEIGGIEGDLPRIDAGAVQRAPQIGEKGTDRPLKEQGATAQARTAAADLHAARNGTSDLGDAAKARTDRETRKAFVERAGDALKRLVHAFRHSARCTEAVLPTNGAPLFDICHSRRLSRTRNQPFGRRHSREIADERRPSTPGRPTTRDVIVSQAQANEAAARRPSHDHVVARLSG